MKTFLLWLPLKFFIFLCFTFRSMNHFNFCFSCEVYVKFHFFPKWMSHCSSTICWKDYSFSISLTVTLSEAVGHILCVLCFIYQYICPFVNTTVLITIDLQQVLKISRCNFSILLLSEKYLGHSVYSAFLYNFLNQLVIMYKKSCWDFNWYCLKSVDQFRKNRHLYKLEASSIWTQYVSPFI